MTNDRKKELFPFFAYSYSKQINSDKYGKVDTYENWAKLIEESPEDVTKITDAATQLSEEEWTVIDNDYNTATSEEAQEESKAISAKKGAKLNKLKSYKKEVKTSETKVDAGNYMQMQKKKKKTASYESGNKMKYQKGTPIPSYGKGTKKCACGCAMVENKAKGGKISYKCACGCKVK